VRSPRRTALLLSVSLACLLASPQAALAVQAHGNFNGDGFDDLVIGAPGEGVGAKLEAGAVTVIYGAPNASCGGSGGALKPSAGPGAQTFHQASPGFAGQAETGDRFGAALATGDFNGDNFQDLAIGAPGEGVGSLDGGGLVNVIYGSANGLATSAGPGVQAFHQGTPGVPGQVEAEDGFGSALVSDELNPTPAVPPREDLAIGAPGEGIGAANAAGLVNVLYDFFDGDPSGPAAAAQALHQDSPGVPGEVENDDEFGTALAVGQFRFDPGPPPAISDGLAIGAPGEGVNGREDAGLVNVLYYNSPQGVSGSAGPAGRPAAQAFTQDTPGVPNTAERIDRFGQALAARGFLGELGTADDLAVGAPGEAIGSRRNAGLLNAIPGSETGLTGPNSLEVYQGSGGIFGAAGQAEEGDLFGSAIGASPRSEGVAPSLPVGAPGEDIGPDRDAGLVNLLFRESFAPEAVYHQDSPGTLNSAEDGDRFGSAISVADFSCNVLDSNPEMAVGVPDENIAGVVDAGLVNVRYDQDGPGNPIAPQQAFSQASPGIPGQAEAFDVFGLGL
jgi:hypothetical protein